MKRVILAATLLTAVGLAPFTLGQTTPAPATRPVGSDAQPVALLLEQAIYQEETAGNPEAAAKTYKQIASQAAVTRALVAQSLYRLAMLQLKQKQTDDAQSTIQQLLTEYPEQKDLIAKAQAALPAVAAPASGAVAFPMPGELSAATTAEMKTQAEALVKKGWQLLQVGKFEDANKAFSEAANLDGYSPAAFAGIGWSELSRSQAGQQSQPAEQIRYYFDQALERDPKNTVALNGIASLLQTNDPRAAISFWKRALEADPTTTLAMSGLAQSCARLGRYDDAVSAYDKWLKADPNNADAKIGLNAVKASEAAVKDAAAVVESFLKRMDAGQYAASYQLVSPQFSGAKSAAIWEETGNASFSPLGKVVSRKVDTALPGSIAQSRGDYSGRVSGIGGPPGAGGFGNPAGGGRSGRSGPVARDGLLSRGVDPNEIDLARFQFVTQFEHKKDVTECITATKDAGEWRITEYTIESPKPSIDPLRAR